MGGVDAVTDLSTELASKVAELVKHVASAQGLAAGDIVDLWFVD